MSNLLQKATKDRAIEILDYFETKSFDHCGSRDLIEMLVETLRDGCVGYANKDGQYILDLLKHHVLPDEELETEEEEFQEYHEELKKVIDLVEADLAIVDILEDKNA